MRVSAAFAQCLRHLAIIAACLCAAAPELSAADRSVTIIEGVEEQPPRPEPLPPTAASLTDIKTDNPAGLELAILPNGVLQLGTRVAFTVSTQRPGYLVLVDINAAGTLTQIFPKHAVAVTNGRQRRGWQSHQARGAAHRAESQEPRWPVSSSRPICRAAAVPSWPSSATGRYRSSTSRKHRIRRVRSRRRSMLSKRRSPA